MNFIATRIQSKKMRFYDASCPRHIETLPDEEEEEDGVERNTLYNMCASCDRLLRLVYGGAPEHRIV